MIFHADRKDVSAVEVETQLCRRCRLTSLVLGEQLRDWHSERIGEPLNDNDRWIASR
jgi:hypothetical protein